MSDTVQQRRRWWRWALLVLAGIVVLSLTCCTSTITPPKDPKDPVTVFLLTTAMHKGIVLPRDEASYVEYGFGDLDWYAYNYNSWYNVFDTVLWPTQGTLGRKTVNAKGPDEVQASYGKLVHPIRVERAKAMALLVELDKTFSDSTTETPHYNGSYDMHFVVDDHSFWFLYNCNDSVAEWLRKLGCEVSFVPVRLGLSLASR